MLRVATLRRNGDSVHGVGAELRAHFETAVPLCCAATDDDAAAREPRGCATNQATGRADARAGGTGRGAQVREFYYYMFRDIV